MRRTLAVVEVRVVPDMTEAALDGRGGRACVGRRGDGSADTTDAPPDDTGSGNLSGNRWCCCWMRAAAALSGRWPALDPPAPPDATDAPDPWDLPAPLTPFAGPVAAVRRAREGLARLDVRSGGDGTMISRQARPGLTCAGGRGWRAWM